MKEKGGDEEVKKDKNEVMKDDQYQEGESDKGGGD